MSSSQSYIAAASTGHVIGAAIEVHRHLGPGLLESTYEECLACEMRARGIPFERQVPLEVRYKGATIDGRYRMDFVVEQTVVVELKAVEAFSEAHEAQLLTYLLHSGLPVGLMLNFNVQRLTRGIMRRVLTKVRPPPR